MQVCDFFLPKPSESMIRVSIRTSFPSLGGESNPGPFAYEANALPTEAVKPFDQRRRERMTSVLSPEVVSIAAPT